MCAAQWERGNAPVVFRACVSKHQVPLLYAPIVGRARVAAAVAGQGRRGRVQLVVATGGERREKCMLAKRRRLRSAH